MYFLHFRGGSWHIWEGRVHCEKEFPVPHAPLRWKPALYPKIVIRDFLSILLFTKYDDAIDVQGFLLPPGERSASLTAQLYCYLESIPVLSSDWSYHTTLPSTFAPAGLGDFASLSPQTFPHISLCHAASCKVKPASSLKCVPNATLAQSAVNHVCTRTCVCVNIHGGVKFWSKVKIRTVVG